jgi:hypothetical protein
MAALLLVFAFGASKECLPWYLQVRGMVPAAFVWPFQLLPSTTNVPCPEESGSEHIHQRWKSDCARSMMAFSRVATAASRFSPTPQSGCSDWPIDLPPQIQFVTQDFEFCSPLLLIFLAPDSRRFKSRDRSFGSQSSEKVKHRLLYTRSCELLLHTFVVFASQLYLKTEQGGGTGVWSEGLEVFQDDPTNWAPELAG